MIILIAGSEILEVCDFKVCYTYNDLAFQNWVFDSEGRSILLACCMLLLSIINE